MQIRKVFLFLSFIFFSIYGWAKKELVFLGGGGEPPGASTVFDSTFYNMVPFSKASEWTSRSYFDGGHLNSEHIAKVVMGDRNKPMTAANVNAEIKNLKRKILNGELKKGDQLLLTIATHGVKKMKQQITHSVTTTDDVVNLDSLQEVRDLAEKKGVSLAILDFSCYSGNTLKLGTTKTCVMSVATDAIGYTSSGATVARNLQKGRNLEEVFLTSRKSDVVPGAPQINTEAGKKAYELTKVLTQSMQEREYLKTTRQMGDECYGLKSQPYAKLVRALKEIQVNHNIFDFIKATFGDIPENEKLILKLNSAVKKYENSRNRLQNSFDQAQKLDVTQCLKIGNIYSCGSMTNWWDAYRGLSEKKKKGTFTKNNEQEMKILVEFMKSPSFAKWYTHRLNLDRGSSLSREAMDVARAERDVYDAIYNEFSKISTQPNPCRNFVL